MLTSITTFSMSDPDSVDSICYDQAADGVYASQDALYISEPRFDSTGPTRTRIHKFSLGGTRAEYSGSAEVPGAVWGMGQPDFRMSESDGVLRVMTTESTSDPADFARPSPVRLAPETGRARTRDRRTPAQRFAAGRNRQAQRVAVRRALRRQSRLCRDVPAASILCTCSTFRHPPIRASQAQLEMPGLLRVPAPGERRPAAGARLRHQRISSSSCSTPPCSNIRSRAAPSRWAASTSSSPALYDRHAFTYLAGTDADRLAVPAYVVTELPSPTDQLRHRAAPVRDPRQADPFECLAAGGGSGCAAGSSQVAGAQSRLHRR